MQVQAYKDIRNNWSCESWAQIKDNWWLRVSTSKNYKGQLNTIAIAGVRSNSGSFTYIPTEDFTKIVISTTPNRITAKAVETQHAQVDIDSLIEEAKAFY